MAWGFRDKHEEDRSLADEVLGGVPLATEPLYDYVPAADTAEPYPSAPSGDGKIYWEPVQDPRLTGGRPFVRTGPDGFQTFHTAEEYQAELELPDEDILHAAGYRPDPRLQRLNDIADRLGRDSAATSTEEDDDFEIEIGELKGLKIKGKGTLERFLRGDTAPAQPSLADQLVTDLLTQRLGGTFTAPGDIPYMPAEHASPWGEQYQPYIDRQITDAPYGDPHNWAAADEQQGESLTEDVYLGAPAPQPNYTQSLYPDYTPGTYGQPAEELQDLPEEQSETDEQAINNSEAASEKARNARRVGKTVFRGLRKIGVVRMSKIAAASLIVLAGPSYVYNDVPTSFAEGVADVIVTPPKLIGDGIGLINLIRK